MKVLTVEEALAEGIALESLPSVSEKDAEVMNHAAAREAEAHELLDEGIEARKRGALSSAALRKLIRKAAHATERVFRASYRAIRRYSRRAVSRRSNVVRLSARARERRTQSERGPPADGKDSDEPHPPAGGAA